MCPVTYLVPFPWRTLATPRRKHSQYVFCQHLQNPKALSVSSGNKIFPGNTKMLLAFFTVLQMHNDAETMSDETAGALAWIKAVTVVYPSWLCTCNETKQNKMPATVKDVFEEALSAIHLIQSLSLSPLENILRNEMWKMYEYFWCIQKYTVSRKCTCVVKLWVSIRFLCTIPFYLKERSTNYVHSDILHMFPWKWLEMIVTWRRKADNICYQWYNLSFPVITWILGNTYLLS